MDREKNKIHRDLARDLRGSMTDSERYLWEYLRKRQLAGYRFRRQMPLGRYIADFVCLEVRLIIELDGSHHHEQKAYDQERDAWLMAQNFQVLRFWNHQVLNQTETVLQQIQRTLQQRHHDFLAPFTPCGGRVGDGG